MKATPAIGGVLRFFALPRAVYWLSGAAFFASLSTMATKFAALYLSLGFDYSIEEIGRTLAAYGLGAILGALGGGYFLGRFGSQAILVASLAALVPAFLGFALAPPLAIPFVLFIVGILQSAFRPAYNGALLALCPPDDRARSYSAYITAVNIGGAIAGGLGGILAAHDFRLIFLFSALPPVIAAFFVLKALAGVSRAPDRSSHHAAQPGHRLAVLRDRCFMALCLLELICAFIMAQLFSTYPIYLKDEYGFTPDQFGYLLMASSLLVAGLSLPLTTLSGKYRDDIVAVLAIACFGGGFAMLPMSSAVWFAVTAMIVWTLGEILLWPILMKLVMQRAEQAAGGAYLGIYHSIFSISQIVSPVLGAAIYSAMGGRALWIICGGLGALAIAVLRIFDLGRPESCDKPTAGFHT